MHQLIVEILTRRDLSRAGDLFTIDDHLIEQDLHELIGTIQEIADEPGFEQRQNDQSIVEICLTRVTSAIRDTGTIEKHASSLVALLESCLKHNLKPLSKDEDPPHAKIASDVVSCIFLNHSKRSVMQRAVPSAIRMLHRGNKELSRNLSSYLSLAAINHADVLSPYIQPIIDSIISGNYVLARVLPKIYIERHEPIHDHIMAIVSLLPACELPEKLALLNLIALISKTKPAILEPHIPQLCDCLTQADAGPQVAYTTLQIFLEMATADPQPFQDMSPQIVSAVESNNGLLSLAAQLLALVGKLDSDRGRDCLNFLVNQLAKGDLSTTIALLREIKNIGETFPTLLNSVLPQIVALVESSSSSTVHSYLAQLNSLVTKGSTHSSYDCLEGSRHSSVTVLRVNHQAAAPPNKRQSSAAQYAAGIYAALPPPPTPSASGNGGGNDSGISLLRSPTHNKYQQYHHHHHHHHHHPNNSGYHNPPTHNSVYRSIPRLHIVNGGHITRAFQGGGGGGGGGQTSSGQQSSHHKQHALNLMPHRSLTALQMANFNSKLSAAPPLQQQQPPTSAAQLPPTALSILPNTTTTPTSPSAQQQQQNNFYHYGMTQQRVNSNKGVPTTPISIPNSNRVSMESFNASHAQQPQSLQFQHQQQTSVIYSPMVGNYYLGRHAHDRIPGGGNLLPDPSLVGGGHHRGGLDGSPPHSARSASSSYLLALQEREQRELERLAREHQAAMNQQRILTSTSTDSQLDDHNHAHHHHHNQHGGHHVTNRVISSSTTSSSQSQHNLTARNSKTELNTQSNYGGRQSVPNTYATPSDSPTTTLAMNQNQNNQNHLTHADVGTSEEFGGGGGEYDSYGNLSPPARDAVLQFCEKHIDKIAAYMTKMQVKLPLPVECRLEEKKLKKVIKLHFICHGRRSSSAAGQLDQQQQLTECAYQRETVFILKTRHARTWIHLMFLSLQARSAPTPLSTRDPRVNALKLTWNQLQSDGAKSRSSSTSFSSVVTSSFPGAKEQDTLMAELRANRYFDIFEFNALTMSWACFLCNHPDKNLMMGAGLSAGLARSQSKPNTPAPPPRHNRRSASMDESSRSTSSTPSKQQQIQTANSEKQNGSNSENIPNNHQTHHAYHHLHHQSQHQPPHHVTPPTSKSPPLMMMGSTGSPESPDPSLIEGQLREKGRGKWNLFKRWRTRYFTLSGIHLSYRESKGKQESQPIAVGEIRSVRAIGSRGGRTIPKAFEIFTQDKTYMVKSKDWQNTEKWVQCLSAAMTSSSTSAANVSTPPTTNGMTDAVGGPHHHHQSWMSSGAGSLQQGGPPHSPPPAGQPFATAVH